MYCHLRKIKLDNFRMICDTFWYRPYWVCCKTYGAPCRLLYINQRLLWSLLTCLKLSDHINLAAFSSVIYNNIEIWNITFQIQFFFSKKRNISGLHEKFAWGLLCYSSIKQKNSLSSLFFTQNSPSQYLNGFPGQNF